MNSLILATATRYLMPLLMLFSIFLLWRGHNEPGGGFVGGLVAGAAFALHALAEGVPAARRVLRVDPRALIPAGLLVAVMSGLVGSTAGHNVLTGVWSEATLPVLGKIGSPVIFDAGVYLVVFGATLTILFTLAEDD